MPDSEEASFEMELQPSIFRWMTSVSHVEERKKKETVEVITFSPLPPLRPLIPSAPCGETEIESGLNSENMEIHHGRVVLCDLRDRAYFHTTRPRVADGSHRTRMTLKSCKKVSRERQSNYNNMHRPLLQCVSAVLDNFTDFPMNSELSRSFWTKLCM